MTQAYDGNELRKIRVWVAVAAIGLLLNGLGTIASLGVLDELSDQAEKLEASVEEAEKDSEADSAPESDGDFWTDASELYATAKLEELNKLIADGLVNRPNDGELYWWRARLNVAKGEYAEALAQLDLAQLHSTPWTKDQIDSFREAIVRMMHPDR